ncbi:methanethiol S-methyltransferase [Mycobacterium montefiorense]|uniref:methanethiol S-methyltransferase n=1 Tax=Mycobacterium montefiorense TaxID=154654 RepID=UPI0021F3391F|nr:methanethiol S-methyltransferase [Mycobacterium montefiorense]MCV7426677.1 isoprenylcysteine carboxylmethyltransferase family protein [Mycobacterium montefiorense]
MSRYLTVCYGAVAYLLFLVSFGYAIGFVGNIWVPRSVDHALSSPVGLAVLIDVALLGVFAIQHSVMARPAFKKLWTRIVPVSIERSTYVALASAALLLLYWQWRMLPGIVWDVSLPAAQVLGWVLFWLGWATVFFSSFMVSHFDLFGLRQVYLAWRGKPYRNLDFRVRYLYRLVRHPLMLGFLIGFWATPVMTVGHLLFSVATTAYILIALRLEEHDLVEALGDQYRAYRAEVPALVPGTRRHPNAAAGQH